MVTNLQRIRRLNRILSRQSGALNQSFLGRGRPLNAARVLWSLSQGKSEVSDIRADLELDSGLMSRLLRSLEEDGLIEVRAGEKDARKRTVTFTQAGREEFAVYDKLSDDVAAKVLANYDAQQKLLEAVDLVASVYGRDHIEIIEVDPEDKRFVDCTQSFAREVTEELNIPFSLEKTGTTDLSTLRPPKGICLLALSEDMPVGSVSVKAHADAEGEVKRMWIHPSARGLGLSTRMMRQLEDHARSFGMTRLVLDTNGKLTAALGLYQKSGWSEIERYNDNPYAQHFFEKWL